MRASGCWVIVLGAVTSGCFLQESVAEPGERDSTVPDVDAFFVEEDIGVGVDAGPRPDANVADIDAFVVGEDAGVERVDAFVPMDGGVDACMGGGEVCDGTGLDEDCDGLVDLADPDCECIDGSTRSCEPADGCAGTETCAAGSWGACVTTPPVRECNGVDDDCDGVIDDESDCEGDTGCRFFPRSGHSYLFCDPGSAGTQSFDDAQAFCNAHGYALATIEGAAENDALHEFGDMVDSSERFWIGLRANAWVSGSAATFRDSGSPGGSECALLDTGGLGGSDWGGADCADANSFLCEAYPPE